MFVDPIKEATEHLNYARKERLYYKAHSHIAKIDYEKIFTRQTQ